MTTRSPIRSRLTPAPTATIVPVPSWPTIHGKSTGRAAGPDREIGAAHPDAGEPDHYLALAGFRFRPVRRHRDLAGAGEDRSLHLSAFPSPRVMPHRPWSRGLLRGHPDQRVPRSVSRVPRFTVDDLEQHAALRRGDVEMTQRPPGGILVVQDVARGGRCQATRRRARAWRRGPRSSCRARAARKGPARRRPGRLHDVGRPNRHVLHQVRPRPPAAEHWHVDDEPDRLSPRCRRSAPGF